MRRRRTWLIILGIVFLLALLVEGFVSFISEYWWFSSLGYTQLFWKPIVYSLILFAGGVLSFLIIVGVNVYLSFAFGLDISSPRSRWIFRYMGPRVLNLISRLTIFVLAVVFGFIWTSFIKEFMFFIGARPLGDFTGIKDPVFFKDVSYYLFRYPFWRKVITSLLVEGLLAIIFSFVIYFVLGRAPGGTVQISKKGLSHLTILTSLYLVSLGFSRLFFAKSYLVKQNGLLFGVDYVSFLKIKLMPAFVAICVISAVIVLLINFMNDPSKIGKYVGLSLTLPLGFWVIFIELLPALVNTFLVKPNELEKQKLYLSYNIQFTRKGFGIDSVKEVSFPVSYSLTKEKIERNQDILSSIRLWDWRPLLKTYSQLQEIRLYYEFLDVDIDRYRVEINGEPALREVMLSVRELDPDQLPVDARTWVNTRLKYTHGYGLCLSPVNLKTSEGLPVFWIKDIPPVSEHFNITEPRIYYGEAATKYVIAATREKEFDYPMGDENVYTHYNGRGGVKLDSLLKRFVFAWKFSDLGILLSSSISKSSSILFHRNILERVGKLLPLLLTDPDPYPVISNGKIYWIIDIYTFSNKFPYSTPVKGVNYIRSPIKAVVDAYHGTVDFYVVQDDEYFVKVLQNLFPGVFKPFEEMPEGLKEHIRYPALLFELQAKSYALYHMKDVTVFYNREDAWTFPKELYAGDIEEVQPYYVTLKFPWQKNLGFYVMITYTPVGKDNLVSWFSASCDPQSYGELVVYKFPKKKLIYGPMQIEARIDQDPYISSKLTLWSQRGSNVVRGNLLVIPIEDTLLYVEPLFLQAEQGQLPELKKVIVAHGNAVVMEDTFQEAIEALLSHHYTHPEEETEVSREVVEAKSIKELYLKAQKALTKGDLEEFGRIWKKLGELIGETE